MKMTQIGKTEFIFGSIAILFPFITIFQGLDFTDMGYCIFKYNNFFNPQMAIDSVPTFLTDFTGGVWSLISPVSGVISYKLLFAFSVLATQVFAFISLRNSVNTKNLITGILLATLCITPEMQWFSYNVSSALMFVISGFLLIKTTEKPSFFRYLSSSLVMGLTAFMRIPNILGYLLFLIPIVVNFRKNDKKTWLQPVMAIAAGAILSGGILLLLVIISGKMKMFSDMLYSSLQSSEDPGNNHSILYLLIKQLADFAKAILAMGVFILVFMIAKKIGKIFTSEKTGRIVIPLLSFLLFALIPYLPVHLLELHIEKTIAYFSILVFSALSILLIPFLYKNRNNWRRQYILFIAVGIMLVVPQGSGRGLMNLIYGMWLIVPLGYTIFRESKMQLASATANAQNGIFLTVLIFILAHSFTLIYRDDPNRFNLRYGLDHPLLRCIYTTEKRARTVNGLIRKVNDLKIGGKQLLTYQSLPLIHYIFNTQPYLDESWTLLLPAGRIKSLLAEKSKTNNSLPYAIRAKFQAREETWPVRPIRKRKKTQREKNDQVKTQILELFLKKNNYRLIWQNDYFEILQPGR